MRIMRVAVSYLQNKMIIVNLKGGIGNQMFQYALGRKLSIQNEEELKLDITGLEKANVVGDIYRPFALDAYAVQKSFADASEINKLKYPLGIVSRFLRWFTFKILRQTHVGFEPDILNETGSFYIDGFWQSPKYFDDIRDVLLKDCTLVTPVSDAVTKYTEMLSIENSVSIHIRRGDYVTNPRVLKEFGMCSEVYYQKATSYFQENLVNPSFFVFSDDIQWVQEHLELPDNTMYVSDQKLTAEEELILMSTCAHNIIANSSFSWWGAWLNQNPEKIVIAPTPWFNKNDHLYKDLIPQSWITLPRD
tara:strand:- start:874 stop:1788 length:915 start_codon:yes stop_codon:yes gene_type:complete